MISTLILTRNEEADLPGCLESVAWCDDVHVFDSCSTDRTAEIARSHGANFIQREFDGYASQRNAALDTLPFRHEWIFILDADERCTPELAQEMPQAISAAAPDVNGFRLRRRDFPPETPITWLPTAPGVLSFTRGDIACIANLSQSSVALPVGDVLLASIPLPGDHLPADTTAWLRLPSPH